MFKAPFVVCVCVHDSGGYTFSDQLEFTRISKGAIHFQSQVNAIRHLHDTTKNISRMDFIVLYILESYGVQSHIFRNTIKSFRNILQEKKSYMLCFV